MGLELCILSISWDAAAASDEREGQEWRVCCGLLTCLDSAVSTSSSAVIPHTSSIFWPLPRLAKADISCHWQTVDVTMTADKGDMLAHETVFEVVSACLSPSHRRVFRRENGILYGH